MCPRLTHRHHRFRCRRRILQHDYELGQAHLKEEVRRRRSLMQVDDAAEESSKGSSDGEQQKEEEEPVVFNKKVAVTPAQLVGAYATYSALAPPADREVERSHDPHTS